MHLHNTIEHAHAKILVHLNAKCHALTLMVKLLIIDEIYHLPQNRVNDIVTQVILNAKNIVVNPLLAIEVGWWVKHKKTT
jgi:DNA replication protein DnaC